MQELAENTAVLLGPVLEAVTLIPQNLLFRHRNSTKARSQLPVLELPGTLVEKVSRENSQYSLETTRDASVNQVKGPCSVAGITWSVSKVNSKVPCPVTGSAARTEGYGRWDWRAKKTSQSPLTFKVTVTKAN